MAKPLLIVESIPAVQRALENLLKSAGCKNVLSASSAEKAKTLLEQEKTIGVLIVDWDLGDGSGFEFYKNLRDTGALTDRRCILTFKKKSKEQILEAIKQGVHGFLVKPFAQAPVKKIMAELGKCLDEPLAESSVIPTASAQSKP